MNIVNRIFDLQKRASDDKTAFYSRYGTFVSCALIAFQENRVMQLTTRNPKVRYRICIQNIDTYTHGSPLFFFSSSSKILLLKNCPKV